MLDYIENYYNCGTHSQIILYPEFSSLTQNPYINNCRLTAIISIPPIKPYIER
jgi:hypothetical protein